MIDKTQKHSYTLERESKVVVYFGKYDFTNGAEIVHDIKSMDSPYSFSKDEILTAALVANKFNKKYVKAAGFFDIVEGEFVKTAFSNKEILASILVSYPHLVLDEDRKKASEIMRYLEGEFSFKILADTLTEFESSIANFLGADNDSLAQVLGVAAYLPTYYDNAVKNDELRERSFHAGHLGEVGEKVITNIEILRSKYLAETAFGGSGYMVSAISVDDHRISFFTTNDDLANSTGNFKISCKVKSLGTAWKEDTINETKVNYVRMIEPKT